MVRELYNFLSQINICLSDIARSNEQISVLDFMIKMAYDLMAQKPHFAEKAFKLFRKQGAEVSVSLIKSLVRDYKDATSRTAAALTTFPPAKASTKNVLDTPSANRVVRKP